MIYLNNAATTYPKPENVIRSVSGCISNPPDNSKRRGISSDSKDIFDDTRKLIKKLFDIRDEPEQIIFSSGSTESLNTIIKGLDLQDKHIITTATEHNSMLRPLHGLADDNIIELTVVECDSTGFVNPDDIKKHIKKNTTLIAVNHCSNVTGTIQDLKEISKIAHDNNAMLLSDSSQASGSFEFSVNDLGIDMLAFTGHKSLYGIQGTGGFYIRSGIDIKPLKTGGTGIMGENRLQPEKMPYYLESGTPNTPGITALNVGINWILEKGINNIHDKKKKLTEKLFSEFKDNKNLIIYNSLSNNSHSVFTFNIKDIVPEEVNFIFDQSFDIKIRSGIHCAPLIREHLGAYPFGTLRVSPSYFNTTEEIDKFIDALYKIIESFK